MPFLTVCVVVIQEGKVLLTLREDFRIWCLPSGGVEDGEDLVAAALRETKEETGLDVEIIRLVGSIVALPTSPAGMPWNSPPFPQAARSRYSRVKPWMFAISLLMIFPQLFYLGTTAVF
jgi:8-oxo-dGTP pyrophosphatase MutT (NUDIX family)